MTVSARFCHLHLHTSYSLLDGAVRISELVPAIGELGMKQVAITDHGNMFGALDFYLQTRKAGIKPIIGCEVYVAPADRRDRTRRGTYHLILLARNETGYRNLLYLVSMAHTEGFYYRPRIDRELLAERSEGLVGLSACLGGEIPRALREKGLARAERVAAEHRDLFEKGSFYLEVQSNGYPEQTELNLALRTIGQRLTLPLVATNDVHYLRADDAAVHDVLMRIQTGHVLGDAKHTKLHSDELFLRSPEQMLAALPGFEDAVERTLEVAELCNVDIGLDTLYLPEYEVPEGHTLESYLREAARAGLEDRLRGDRESGRAVDEKQYWGRLETELSTITGMGYAGYYLIVWDFIREAKARGIPVGPGRGSGAGSLVAYAIRITELDPIRYGLLFERFLNPERVSMPDFDVDFCKNRRDEVIKYVAERYGHDRVGQIATFHMLKPRSVVRDVGRVMGLPHPMVDRIAKLVPEPTVAGTKLTLAQALEMEPRLKAEFDRDATVKELLGYAMRLEGLHRHAGTHAGGVVIGRKPLWEYVPVFSSQHAESTQEAELVTQFDKDMVERCGLVKFDLLGLKTMTVIDTALALIARRPDSGGERIDLSRVPLDDKATYDLIGTGDTTGVFQMESSGFRDLVRRLKPDKFEEIIAVLALYRPGPLQGGMVDQYVECKHGRREIVYPHDRLHDILAETYGVLVYQEQVMQAAQILAGFTLGAADIMRRAMGKKKAEVMAEQRRKFVEGCAARDLKPEKADEVFDLIDKFAGYGFNKSHSAAYALVAYHTAYLKAHYPVEFLAAMLTCDSDDTDRVAKFVAEGRKAGIEVLPPDVNESELSFVVIYDEKGRGRIRFGLGAVKGVGQAGLEALFEARVEAPYLDLFDFCTRVNLQKVNRGMIEALVKAGAFDATSAAVGVTRGPAIAAIDSALERGRSIQRDRESGQASLFGSLDAGGGSADSARGEYPPASPWDERQILAWEKESLGLYISGHPLDRYVDELRTLADAAVTDVYARVGQRVRICGVVEGYRERPLKSGTGRIAFFQLEDLTGRVEVVVRPKVLEELERILQGSDPIICEGVVQLDREREEEEPKLLIDAAVRLSEWRTRYTEVHLRLVADDVTRQQLASVREVLSRHPGRCIPYLHLARGDWEAVVKLPDRFRVDPSDHLLSELEKVLGRKVTEFRC